MRQPVLIYATADPSAVQAVQAQLGVARAGEIVAQRIETMRAAGRPIRAVMLERLGPNVWHRSPAEASAVLEELEETARLWLMTQPEPLSAEQIAELRQHFGASW